MKNTDIWFVIVTYKPDKESLKRFMVMLEGRNTIIVDNTKNNFGYGAGANQGMKRAFGAGARWVVVCNQDITITKHGIAHVTQVLEDSEPGVLGPEAGTLDPNRWTTVLNERDIEFQGSSLGEKYYISGSMMAIHKVVWEKTGGFFEPYFMYYEDVDLSLRAKKAGFPLRQVSLDGYRHGLDKNSNNDKWGKEYYLARNHLLFVRRLAPVRVKIHELMRLPKTLVEHSKTGNAEAIKGVGDFAIGRFGEEIS